MRTVVKIAILLLCIIIVAEIGIYFVLVQRMNNQAIPSTTIVNTPTEIPTPTVVIEQEQHPPIDIRRGTVVRFMEDTGPSGRYAYFLEYTDESGNNVFYRFPKKDMDKVTITYLDTAGTVLQDGASMELTSVLEGDIMELVVHQHEIAHNPGDDHFDYLIIDDIDLKITR